ncbi:MAG: hypothetical protein PHW75_03605, partial [Patescibacteria group bacterium]|nr:hypothetical protein [Patescibacteria group bacterium]
MRERKRKNYTKGYKSNLFIGRSSFLIIAIGLIFSMGLLYISQSNSVAVKGETLSDLEARKAELTEERDRLRIEATRLQSIKEL